VARPKAVPPRDLDAEKISGLLERIRAQMSEEDYGLIAAIVSTLLSITELVAKKKASIRRLTRLLFGERTEKSCTLFPKTESGTDAQRAPPARRRKGHGRKAAEDYPGATRIWVAHPSLKPGDACPQRCGGTLYRLKEGLRLVRFRGAAALDAVLYGLEQLRCALCGKVYTAPALP
jgi:transposase